MARPDGAKKCRRVEFVSLGVQIPFRPRCLISLCGGRLISMTLWVWLRNVLGMALCMCILARCLMILPRSLRRRTPIAAQILTLVLSSLVMLRQWDGRWSFGMPSRVSLLISVIVGWCVSRVLRLSLLRM